MFAKSAVWTTVIGAGALGAAAQAGTVTVEVELPRLGVAEYHKPYVAGWIEDAAGAHRSNLFVWYQAGKGDKWLKDIRTWWRKSGRDLTLPQDGLTSATKAPGRQTVKFDSNSPAFKGLAAGDYVLNVEASREGGGREVVKVPIKWDGKKASAGAAKGASELGDVKFAYKP
ncbi:DUF2271 domain-containing protein [Asticcacaulis sp. BYS171W]|uniref:DUF2271 domain-containing protein n=1 Tax=Asticcacaulis aquaticus TaxID=2984212 RepID=A0ABT5HXG7_9CAUL|nr:DUF2271 domain-containing protein [Asticcacaulis aquaticus]MDC7684638.1 DUF2271 domain-containing protein [Asticcacaulis aquaticus]